MVALGRFTRFVVGYNLAVILWGAYVRASGAGAGCGSHWPLCNGEALPLGAGAKTLVEYTHRLSSGLALLLVLGLAVWAWRVAPQKHPIRFWAALALLFTLSEAAIGAGLVLFKLVAGDQSLARALWIATHQVNTLLLLAALALTARRARVSGQGSPSGGSGAPGVESGEWSREWSGDGNGAGSGAAERALRERGRDARERKAAGGELAASGHPWPARPGAELRWACWLALCGVALIAATGAVAALGDTLFPAASLRQGLARDLSPAGHLLERLRVFHPFLALAVGALLLALCERVAARRAVRPAARAWAQRVRLLVLAQWALGAVNLGLLAPLPLQLAHLLLADLLWLALVVLASEALAAAPAPAVPAAPRPLAPALAPPGAAQCG